jgi:hypothetical protein
MATRKAKTAEQEARLALRRTVDGLKQDLDDANDRADEVLVRLKQKLADRAKALLKEPT